MSESDDPTAKGPTCPVPGAGPKGLRGIRRFLSRPAQDLYDEAFFDCPPEEIRIKLRARDGKVEMVIYTVDPSRMNELTLPFSAEEVFAELCG